MKEEQKYNGSKTRNYFTAYLLASIREKDFGIWKSSRKYYLQRKIWKIKNIQMRIFLQRKGWNWNRKNNCLWKKHRGYIQSGTK